MSSPINPKQLLFKETSKEVVKLNSKVDNNAPISNTNNPISKKKKEGRSGLLWREVDDEHAGSSLEIYQKVIILLPTFVRAITT
jgi:hypothetical protein